MTKPFVRKKYVKGQSLKFKKCPIPESPKTVKRKTFDFSVDLNTGQRGGGQIRA